MAEKRTHSQRVKEGLRRRKQKQERAALLVEPANADLLANQCAGRAVQPGTYEQGFDKGMRIGASRAMARVLIALAEATRDGY